MQPHPIRSIMTALDVHSLPHNIIWNTNTDAAVALQPVVKGLSPAITRLMEAGVIATRESFGFALKNPDSDGTLVWDDPQKLIGLVVYWGPEGPRYAANACRKIRAAAREGQDTELLRRFRVEQFREIVESVEDDGTFTWGDFPYDGATYTEVQGRTLLGAVSAFPKEQDPVVARLITGFLGLAMFNSDQQLIPS